MQREKSNKKCCFSQEVSNKQTLFVLTGRKIKKHILDTGQETSHRVNIIKIEKK